MDTRVYLAGCESYDSEKVSVAVHEILEGFGGAEKLAGGKRVLIKPNLLMPRAPETATTTHPEVVAAIAKEFISAGCQVVIADSCGGTYQPQVLKRLYRVTGMENAANQSGATLNYDTSSMEMTYPEGRLLKRVSVIKPVHDAEFIISVAKLKTHGFTHATGAVKNMFGCIPGLNKPMLHSRFPDKNVFCQMIVDLCEMVSPDFAIIDGVIGMQGSGPSGGIPKSAGVLLGGVNPHAVDLAAVAVMGLEAENVPTLTAAMERGLVPKDIGSLNYIGAAPDKYSFNFNPPPGKIPGRLIRWLPPKIYKHLEKWLLPYPYITENCAGCGDCARSCPAETIAVKDGKAQIDYKNCLKCYCCHELCPIKAITFRRVIKAKRK